MPLIMPRSRHYWVCPKSKSLGYIEHQENPRQEAPAQGIASTWRWQHSSSPTLSASLGDTWNSILCCWNAAWSPCHIERMVLLCSSAFPTLFGLLQPRSIPSCPLCGLRPVHFCRTYGAILWPAGIGDEFRATLHTFLCFVFCHFQNFLSKCYLCSITTPYHVTEKRLSRNGF